MGNAHAGTPSILPLQILLHFRRVWSLATPPPFPPLLSPSLSTANTMVLPLPIPSFWLSYRKVSMKCYSLARAQPLQTIIEVYTFTISSTARTAAALFPATRSLMPAVHPLALRKLQFHHRLRVSTALVPIMEESGHKGLTFINRGVIIAWGHR